jgi:hypothetical protein
MGLLRRIFGGGRGNGEDETAAGIDDQGSQGSTDPDADERQHELDVLRAEAERLDELTQRQLKYADYAWQPPDQGGERRADDADSASRS